MKPDTAGGTKPQDPGCPIGPLIEDQMRAFLAPVPGIGDVRPEMVLRPAWSPEMMSEEAKAALGMF